jgi:predicted AlkP superfamily phosphohydrolase/phosphomutase
MPNLGGAVKRGLSAELESVIPPVTAAAWSSFMTGKNPSKHDVFGFTRFEPQTYSIKLNNSSCIRSKTVWQILSEKGKRIVTLQLPFTYPPYKVNGRLVSGWDMPSTKVNFTYPETLREEILALIPDLEETLNLALTEWITIDSDTVYVALVTKFMRAFEQGTEMAMHFLECEDWDVFMIHFQQTDFIQHKLWSYIEQACKEPKNKSLRLEKIRECYRHYDDGVGQLLRKVEPVNPVRIILSDHGFGDYKGVIAPNHYLQEWGYLRLKNDGDGGALGPIKEFFKKSKYESLRRSYAMLAQAKNALLDRRMLKKYKSWAHYAKDTLHDDAINRLPIDWKKTKVATVSATQVALLFVNMAGRGPQGVVRSGNDYEDLVSDLLTRLADLRHPLTGQKVIALAARGRDVYTGFDDRVMLPDIVLIPVDGYGFSTSLTEYAPTLSTSGLHRQFGIFIAEGDGIKRSVANFHPKLIDVVPTILHMLGLAVPADMDGRVLQEMFSDPSEVVYEDAREQLVTADVSYTSQESAVVEERLRGLGYIE